MEPGTADEERDAAEETWRRCHQVAHEGLESIKAAPRDTHHHLPPRPLLGEGPPGRGSGCGRPERARAYRRKALGSHRLGSLVLTSGQPKLEVRAQHQPAAP